MADQADVETALVSIISNALYPNGTAAGSAIGSTCRIYRGFPSAPSLDTDLASGVLHISAIATGAVKNVTRYPQIWQAVTPVAATLTVLLGPQSASFSGTCIVGQLAGVAVNGATFPYAVQATDSPATVASNLAALLRAADWLVDYAGSTITIPGADSFTARVVNGAGSLQEIKRQVQEFKITLWCPDPVSRDAATPLIDEALTLSKFIALSDGSYARMIFLGSDVSDDVADATLYKRNLLYSAEYPTTLLQMTPAMLFGTNYYTANADFVESL
jgi:uncharacterized protein YaiE (UPF0345 family)